MSIKIGVVGTATSYTRRLQDFLSHSQGYELVFTVIDALLLDRCMSRQVPDVLLLCWNGGIPDVGAVISELYRKWRAVKVMVIGDQTDIGLVRRIIEAGSHGYVNERTELSTLLEGCLQLCAGQIFFDPVTEKQLLKEIIYGD